MGADGPIVQTSAPLESGSHSAPAQSTGLHRYTFPPFPQLPPGVELIAFADFQEYGIRIDPGPDDEEVDALGVPTVAMKKRHAGTDECKSNTKRRKKLEEDKKIKLSGEKVRKKDWWEVWEERAENNRHCVGFDSSWPINSRLQAACIDFTKDHFWPPQTLTQTGPRFIWDKFLAYIGLPDGGEVLLGKKAKKKAKAMGADFEEEDEMSDDEDLFDENMMSAGPGIVEPNDDDETLQFLKRTLNSNEERAQFFLEDPVRCIQVFMSSHSWRKGFVWSEPNIPIIPRMVGYFLNYLLRSKVLPEIRNQLQSALKVVAIASTELPNCSQFMKNSPDPFAEGCKDLFGQKADGYSVAQVEISDKFASPTDNTTVETNETQPTTDSGTWGAGDSSGWGDHGSTKPGEGWTSGLDACGWQPIEEVVPDDQGTSIWTMNETDWSSEPKAHPHFALFGPTAFPMTHRPGIVERSMRRIQSITPPNPNPPNSAEAEGPDASAVEIDLDKKLFKLTLVPMIDWDGGEAPVYSRPSILETSCGAVIKASDAPVDNATPSGSEPKPHDPLKDEITLLITPDQASLLRVGMGIGGTFVQLVRQEGQVKKKKKGKSKKPLVYWYVEEMAFVAVSYWSFVA